MSKELENNLIESIQTYLDERLRSIDEQLANLQSDFNTALTRARDAFRDAFAAVQAAADEVTS